MKKLITGIIIGFTLGASIGSVIAVGVVKYEIASKDAGSFVGYGTPDTGDTIYRIKCDADGTLRIR